MENTSLEMKLHIYIYYLVKCLIMTAHECLNFTSVFKAFFKTMVMLDMH